RHARHLLDRGGGLRLGLVVAVVVARAHVDDPDDEFVRGAREARPEEPQGADGAGDPERLDGLAAAPPSCRVEHGPTPWREFDAEEATPGILRKRRTRAHSGPQAPVPKGIRKRPPFDPATAACPTLERR